MTREEMLMLALAGERTDETTGVLIDMIVGTVLMRVAEDDRGYMDLIKQDGMVSFSPADLNRFWQYYDVQRGLVDSEGRITFNVVERYTPAKPLGVDPFEDMTNVKPQAMPKPHDRPLWAVRFNGKFRKKLNKPNAQLHARDLIARYPDAIVQVENRMCLHDTCPAEKCTNPPEVASGRVDNQSD